MKLKDIVTFVSKSVVPQNGTTYNLYSLPSFDENKSAEVLDGAEIQSNKYDVPNKCILFNKLNVRFKRVWRINNSDSNKIASTEFLPLVVNEDVVDYQYCYYLLISDEITNYLCGQNSNTSGSHKRIDPQNFLNIDIHLPKMPIQKTIGKTLSDIDSKIELNKRINDNLRASRAQSQTQFELCRGAAVNAGLRTKSGRTEFSLLKFAHSSAEGEADHAA